MFMAAFVMLQRGKLMPDSARRWQLVQSRSAKVGGTDQTRDRGCHQSADKRLDCRHLRRYFLRRTQMWLINNR
jgi:hypothetical protein